MFNHHRAMKVTRGGRYSKRWKKADGFYIFSVWLKEAMAKHRQIEEYIDYLYVKGSDISFLYRLFLIANRENNPSTAIQNARRDYRRKDCTSMDKLLIGHLSLDEIPDDSSETFRDTEA